MIFHPDLFEATQNYAPEMVLCLTLEDYVVTAKVQVAARRQNALMSQAGQKSEGYLMNEVVCSVQRAENGFGRTHQKDLREIPKNGHRLK